jgi:hypothetical protein
VTASALIESHVTARMATEAQPKAAPRKALMKVGHQHNHSTEFLRLAAALE